MPTRVASRPPACRLVLCAICDQPRDVTVAHNSPTTLQAVLASQISVILDTGSTNTMTARYLLLITNEDGGGGVGTVSSAAEGQ